MPGHTRRRPVDHVRFRNSVYALLKHGEKNAIKSGDLAKALGVYSSRDTSSQRIRQACKELLELDDKWVIACGKGFFIAETEEELDKYDHTIAAKAEGLFRIRSSIKKAKAKMRMKKQNSGYFGFIKDNDIKALETEKN